MVKFENWSIQNPIREVTYYNIEREKAWKAALEWVLSNFDGETDFLTLGLRIREELGYE